MKNLGILIEFVENLFWFCFLAAFALFKRPSMVVTVSEILLFFPLPGAAPNLHGTFHFSFSDPADRGS